MAWVVGLLIHHAPHGIVLAYTFIFIFGSVITNGIAAFTESTA
jgi:hypothetical protein